MHPAISLQNASFIGLLTLVTLAFFGLLADFVQPIFWAATLAVLFRPVGVRCVALYRGRESLGRANDALDHSRYRHYPSLVHRLGRG